MRPLYLPVYGVAVGFGMAKLLALFRDLLGWGWAEILTALTWILLVGLRPHVWTTPLRILLLFGIESTEPAALAIPAMLGQLALVVLAWTSRPFERHRWDGVRSPEALAVLVFCVVVTLATLGPWGAIPLGAVACGCLVTHWLWHERWGGATQWRLQRAADGAECLTLACSCWLF